MIRREYRTKEECTRCWLTEDWSKVHLDTIQNDEYWFEHWYFRAEADEWEDEDERFDYCDAPMWSTWFQPDDMCDMQWLDEHQEEVMELGFTCIYDRDGDLWGLGIDGAGFDFYEAFWVPLYELRGFKWHDEEETAA